MSTIPPVKNLKEIPKDATCQEAAPMSGMRYFACGTPAVAIVDNGDERPYYMCVACTWHNLRNRGASLIFTTDKELKKRMAEGSVKVKK